MRVGPCETGSTGGGARTRGLRNSNRRERTTKPNIGGEVLIFRPREAVFDSRQMSATSLRSIGA